LSVEASPQGVVRAVGAADRAIRISTTVAVLAVAGIAAYVSYWHAYEVVRAHGESSVTARLEPATIDGLVYSSSMVVLYAARHRLAVPALARWLLALGIVATLAANVAHGWPKGPVGAAVAAWPAASLVGSYELLLWLIRTAAARAMVRELAADQAGTPADHQVAALRLVPMPTAQGSSVHQDGLDDQVSPDEPQVASVGQVSGAAQASGPGTTEMRHAYQAVDQMTADPSMLARVIDGSEGGDDDRNAAAVAAYRTSISTGRPLSERKLAAMFGKTSRRWARNRMADARQPLVSGMAESQ
jgi:Protein of unknown function (DUF2637)